eukprot:3674667-Prymnesium_polylepis.1
MKRRRATRATRQTEASRCPSHPPSPRVPSAPWQRTRSCGSARRPRSSARGSDGAVVDAPCAAPSATCCCCCCCCLACVSSRQSPPRSPTYASGVPRLLVHRLRTAPP